jgi:hypothetical protein
MAGNAMLTALSSDPRNALRLAIETEYPRSVELEKPFVCSSAPMFILSGEHLERQRKRLRLVARWKHA